MLQNMDPAVVLPRAANEERTMLPPRISFEDFYERERDGLFGALCLITGNRQDAEDITQDSFVSLWERWGRVSPMDNPTGYLYRTALNAFRKRRRRAALTLRHGVVQRLRQDVFEAVDDRDVLRRTLATLTPRQRAALVVTELFGHTSEEAGRLLGIRPATVRVLTSQARAALTKTLEPSDE
jgi:RNA polymerase sigma-70 factor (ECF subfamily)